MIFDYFDTDDPLARRDLQRIDDLLRSDIFLKALGEEAHTLVVPDDFPIVTDIFHAEKMLHSQEIWDMPEPWPYQYFADITNCIKHSKYTTHDERNKIEKFQRKNIDAFVKQMYKLLDAKYQQHQIIQFLSKIASARESDEANTRDVIEYFQNDIDAFIYYLIDASYYGGIDMWPELRRIYEAFLTGGIPCGWVGPLPENGGDPKKCMQLMHFGLKIN